MRLFALAAAATAVVVLAGGCSEVSWEEHKQAKYEQNMDMLVQRPSLEEIEARYTAMQEEMKTAVVAVAPQVAWETSDELRLDGCSGELSGSGASRVKFPTWTWTWSATDQEWAAMLDAVASVASRYGFSDPNTVAGEPGNRDVRLYNEFEGQVTFGYYTNLILGVQSGCHVRQQNIEKYLAGDREAPEHGPRPKPTSSGG